MSNLTNTQLDNAALVSNYGLSHGFSEKQVEFAIEVAFLESSLGTQLTNPTSTASGLFMYTNPSWSDFHSDIGSKNSISNQISAFFSDLAHFTSRYNDPATNGPIKQAGLTLEEYVYIKHHDGRNYTEFDDAPGLNIWRQSSFNPDITYTPTTWNAAGGVAWYGFDLYDPLYMAAHAHWYTNGNFVPDGKVEIGQLEIVSGEDQDGD